MKRHSLLSITAISVMLMLISFTSSAQTLNIKQLTAELDKMLSEQFKPGETGCTALVAKNGQIIYKKAFGMADLELNVPMQPDMVFRIGSITKQFTAIAILQLMEQGKLSIDDDITKFIPDYPTQAYHISIGHLLTHTSGIKSYTNMPDFDKYSKTDMKPEELIDLFKNQPMEFAPGTKWNYNNSGFFLLGYIIEKVTGKSYQDYIQDNFFTPLGMTSSCYGSDTRIIKNRASGYGPGKDGIENAEYLSMLLPYSAGSIMSTIDDLYRWHSALYSYKLVSKETLDRAHTEYKLADGRGTHYGYGWFLSQLQGSRTIEHGGGINGYLTSSVYLPDEDVFVALFSNSTTKAPEFTSLRMAALAIGKPLKTIEIKLDETALDKYVGVYVNEDGKEITVSREGTQLSAMRSGAPRANMKCIDNDKFIFDESFTYVTFTRDGAGNVVSATVDDRGDVRVWKKTDKKVEVKKAIEIDEAMLDKYVGEYELRPGFIITFTREGNRLFTQATGQDRFEVFAESKTKFFLKVVDAQVEFIPDEDGTVNKMILYQGGQKIEASRIR
jgi:CubicO group peptidase (beta-lactamase class C family)